MFCFCFFFLSCARAHTPFYRNSALHYKNINNFGFVVHFRSSVCFQFRIRLFWIIWSSVTLAVIKFLNGFYVSAVRPLRKIWGWISLMVEAHDGHDKINSFINVRFCHILVFVWSMSTNDWHSQTVNVCKRPENSWAGKRIKKNEIPPVLGVIS